MIFKNFSANCYSHKLLSYIIVEWDMASKSSTHTTVTLCCSFLPAASGSSGLGFGKFNMKKKVFATAKGSVFVTPWDQMQNHMQSHYHSLSATFQPICISHTYICTSHYHMCCYIHIHIHIHAHTLHIYMDTHYTYTCTHYTYTCTHYTYTCTHTTLTCRRGKLFKSGSPLRFSPGAIPFPESKRLKKGVLVVLMWATSWDRLASSVDVSHFLRLSSWKQARESENDPRLTPSISS